MTRNTRHWTEAGRHSMQEKTGHWLWVADEMVGHATPMTTADTVEMMLDDYAADYDACYDGERDPPLCHVWWAEYVDGEMLTEGEHTFTAAH